MSEAASTKAYLRRIVFPVTFGTILLTIGVLYARRHKYIHVGQDERRVVR